MRRVSWVLGAALLVASWSAHATADYFYTFNIDAFTYNGQTYPAAQFTVELNAPPTFGLFGNTLVPVTYDGLAIAGLEVGGFNPNNGQIELLVSAPLTDNGNGLPSGPPGTILAFTSPFIPAFNYQNPIASSGSGSFVIVIGEGSDPADDVFARNVQGTVSVKIVPVPEPGSLSLFGLGVVGIGLMRRRKAS